VHLFGWMGVGACMHVCGVGVCMCMLVPPMLTLRACTQSQITHTQVPLAIT